MILPSVLKSNLIAQQVVSEGQKQPKQLSSKKQAPMNGGGSRGWTGFLYLPAVSECIFAALD